MQRSRDACISMFNPITVYGLECLPFHSKEDPPDQQEIPRSFPSNVHNDVDDQRRPRIIHEGAVVALDLDDTAPTSLRPGALGLGRRCHVPRADDVRLRYGGGDIAGREMHGYVEARPTLVRKPLRCPPLLGLWQHVVQRHHALALRNFYRDVVRALASECLVWNTSMCI